MRAIRLYRRPDTLLRVVLYCAGFLLCALLVVTGIRIAVRAHALHVFMADWSQTTVYSEQRALYVRLMQEIGAVPAEEALHTLVPDTAHNHVINHSSGTFIYQTEGLAGVTDCRPYFTGSCYHGFVSALIADHGITDLSLLAGTCAKAPTALERLNCAHGLGHGLSEGVNHDMVRALDLCHQTFATSSTELSYCFYGVSMENRDLWDQGGQAGMLYEAGDPMYPCDMSAVISRGAHASCWVTQSQRILDAARYPKIGGDVAKAAAYCKTLTDQRDYGTCMSGIEAELFFDIDSSTGGVEEQIASRCAVIQDASASAECVWGVHRFMYYFGDRSANLMQYCTNLSSEDKDRCYESVFYKGIQSSYATTDERTRACKALPEKEYAQACVTQMEHTTY